MTPLFQKYVGPSLLDRICSVENLTTAWRSVYGNIHATRRGHSAGIDEVTLLEFESDWPNQMAILADELRSGLYRPLPARHVAIPKANGSKRVIAILVVRDRVAQRAVKQVLDPVFEPLLHDCSYGCRLRVGVPDALAMVTRYAERGLTWVVDADIATYFDSIDHRILMSMVRQRIDDVPLLHIISRWLDVGTLSDEEAQAYMEELKQRNGHGRQFNHSETPDAGDSPTMQQGMDQRYGFLDNPYGNAAWMRNGMGSYGGGMPLLRDERVWSTLAMVQPVVSGIQQVAPHVQRVGKRVGTKRLVIAGAVAASSAGAVALGEFWRRQREKRRGAMQGGALSPLLANIYLHPFDLAITTRGFRMVRFMDDFVIMCATREDAEQALLLARQQLAHLRLLLNEEKTGIVCYEDGLEFLGQALVPRQQGKTPFQGMKSFAEAAEKLKQFRRRGKRTGDR